MSVSWLYQPLTQWFGSCKSSNANLVMCCHACWMWRDSVARAQMASLRTKRLLSWQGTRWISRHLSILSSSFWFSSLEPWEEWFTQSFRLTKANLESCNLTTMITKTVGTFPRKTVFKKSILLPSFCFRPPQTTSQYADVYFRYFFLNVVNRRLNMLMAIFKRF